jgi:hypothetical protein
MNMRIMSFRRPTGGEIFPSTALKGRLNPAQAEGLGRPTFEMTTQGAHTGPPL